MRSRNFAFALQAKGFDGGDGTRVSVPVDQLYLDGNLNTVTSKQVRGWRGLRLNDVGKELLIGVKSRK